MRYSCSVSATDHAIRSLRMSMHTACTAMLRFSPKLSTFSCVFACTGMSVISGCQHSIHWAFELPELACSDSTTYEPRREVAHCRLHLDVDCAGVRIQQLAQILTDALLVGRQLWALQDDCCIQVTQLIAMVVHESYLHAWRWYQLQTG